MMFATIDIAHAEYLASHPTPQPPEIRQEPDQRTGAVPPYASNGRRRVADARKGVEMTSPIRSALIEDEGAHARWDR